MTLVEAKSGATIASDFTHAVDRLAEGVRLRSPDRVIETRVIYRRTSRQTRGATQLVPWHEVDQLLWANEEAPR